MTHSRLPWLLAAAALLLVGCGGTIAGSPRPDEAERRAREQVTAYFQRGDQAADESPAAAQQFLDDSRHPDYRSPRYACDLEGLVLRADPSMSTLRADPDWAPEDEEAPPGEIYVVAVTYTLEQDRSVLASQIASEHLVLLDGQVYGFPPCPTD